MKREAGGLERDLNRPFKYKMERCKIVISKNAGFCMGVKRAFTKSLELSKKYKNLITYGDLIHNRFALEELYQHHIKSIKNIDELLNDNSENIIIRAHGISPKEEEIIGNKKNIFDLTCPIVKIVQKLAKKLTDDGYFILIYGKDKHPEVIGIKGYCEDNNLVFESIDELNNINLGTLTNNKKLALISQTTMNNFTFEEIALKLKEKYRDISIHNTLCNHPIKNQENSLLLAKTVDIMVIVGDKNSSNTKTLYDKISHISKAIFAESDRDLADFISDIKSAKKIGITAGSSTPLSQIKQIENAIKKIVLS